MNHFITIMIISVMGFISSITYAQSCINNPLTVLPELHIEEGDIFIEGACDGIVLTAPNGTCFRVLLNDDGSFDTESAGCPFVPCATCPTANEAPTFLQGLPDLSLTGNSNCQAMINVPFQVDYCNPNNLSANFSVLGPNAASANLSLNLTAINASTLNYTLSGLMPLGSHNITISIEDPNCGLTTLESFDITVVAPQGTPPTFQCKKIVKTIEDNLPPSVTFNSDDIVCVLDGSSCDGSIPTIISSFSNDPNDTVRIYDCTDLGDLQVTMFIWDVNDFDNNGTVDTVFREPCFAIQTVIDQNGFCQF